MYITSKNLAGKVSQTSGGKGHVDAWGVMAIKGCEARLLLQEEFGGKSVTWMRCKYLYLEATRETKLSKMSVTRKNLAGEVSRGWGVNIYTWRLRGRQSSPWCPSPGRIWREKCHMDEVSILIPGGHKGDKDLHDPSPGGIWWEKCLVDEV